MSEESKLYVGNLAYSTSEESLRSYMEGFGAVLDVKIITDRETGRAKGFGFVTMGSAMDAEKAIEGANDVEFEGRPLRVNKARDGRSSGGSGGFGGGSKGGW